MEHIDLGSTLACDISAQADCCYVYLIDDYDGQHTKKSMMGAEHLRQIAQRMLDVAEKLDTGSS